MRRSWIVGTALVTMLIAGSAVAQLQPVVAAAWRAEVEGMAEDMAVVGSLRDPESVPSVDQDAATRTPGDGVPGLRTDAWRALMEARVKEQPPLEDPLHTWMNVVQAAREGGDVAAAWEAVVGTGIDWVLCCRAQRPRGFARFARRLRRP